MTDIQLNTSDIKVFPAANHTGWAYSRLTTEYNLTNIVNRLVNKEAFVISPTLGESIYTTEGEGTDYKDIEFNISGYWLKINSRRILEKFNDATDNIYAYLNYSTGSGETITLAGDTTDETAGCLTITDEKPDVSVYLHLFTKDEGGSLVIPRNSYIKFKSDSISLDDGDLDLQ